MSRQISILTSAFCLFSSGLAAAQTPPATETPAKQAAPNAPTPAPAAPAQGAPSAPAATAPAEAARSAPAATAPAAPAASSPTTAGAAPAPAQPEPQTMGTETAAPAPPTMSAPSALEAEAATAPDEAVEEPAKAGYEKGFFIQQGVNELAIEARVQTRYTHVSADGAPNEDALAIQRARMTLKGVVLIPQLGYKFQVDFGKGEAGLKDFYFDYCLFDKMFCVRPGQYKRPFSRQQINSSGNQEFVDRALTDKGFGAGRDIGVMIHDNYEKSPVFEYALGFFNGTGEKAHFSGSGMADLDTGEVDVTKGEFSNVPQSWQPALVLRLGYNYGGIKGYSEADLEGGGFRFGLGGSVESHFDADGGDDSLIKYEADAIVKVEGLSASAALYQTSQQDGAGFGDRATGDGGGHFQLGYVIAKTFQPVLRYAYLDPRNEGSDNLQEEYAFGLNYYADGHHLKLQSDLGALTHAEDDTTDWRLRVQSQLSF